MVDMNGLPYEALTHIEFGGRGLEKDVVGDHWSGSSPPKLPWRVSLIVQVCWTDKGMMFKQWRSESIGINNAGETCSMTITNHISLLAFG